MEISCINDNPLPLMEQMINILVIYKFISINIQIRFFTHKDQNLHLYSGKYFNQM